MWSELYVISTLCDQRLMWPAPYVTSTLCDQHFMWPALYVTSSLCDQHFMWPTLYVISTLCDQHFMWSAPYVTSTLCDQHLMWTALYVTSTFCVQYINFVIWTSRNPNIMWPAPFHDFYHLWPVLNIYIISPTIAVATTEADEAIASSDFLKIIGISSPKGADWGDSGQFWSLRLVWFQCLATVMPTILLKRGTFIANHKLVTTLWFVMKVFFYDTWLFEVNHKTCKQCCIAVS